MAPVRKTGDTVEISGRFFNLVAALAIPTVLGVGAVFWNIATSSSALNYRIEALEQFANRGDRWTAVDGRRNSAAIASLKEKYEAHENSTQRLIGVYDTQLEDCERRLSRLEAHGYEWENGR